MTDNEIIKAVEEFINRNENTNYAAITMEFLKYILDLINRQKAEIADLIEKLNATVAGQETLQKALAEKNAEIERFKKIETTVNEFWCVLQKFSKEKLKEKPTLEELLEYIEHAKAEAIKEFAERLKEKAHFSEDFGEAAVACYDIDDLVKEMVGEG